MASGTGERSELDVLREQSRQAWDWFEGTVADVTAEHANWWPPGKANSIGATYLHVVINTDVEVRRLVFDRTPLVEDVFGGEVGQPGAYEPEHFDRWVRHADVDWERLREYGKAVHADLEQWVDELTIEHLEKPIDMTRADLGIWEGREMIDLHGHHHVRLHGGEIAVLKGLQGQVAWQQSAGFHEAVRVDDARRAPADDRPVATFDGAAVIAVLPAPDLDASLDFYVGVLGFEHIFSNGPYYGIRRGPITLHLDGDDDRRTGVSVRVRVADVDAVHGEVESHGMVDPAEPLADTAWGTRQFSVRDPAGNRVTFVRG